MENRPPGSRRSGHGPARIAIHTASASRNELEERPGAKRGPRVKRREGQGEQRRGGWGDEGKIDDGARGEQREVARVLHLLVVERRTVAAPQQQGRHVRGGEIAPPLAGRGHLGPRDQVVRDEDGADTGGDGDRATGSHGGQASTRFGDANAALPYCFLYSADHGEHVHEDRPRGHRGRRPRRRGRLVRAADGGRAVPPPGGGVRRHRGGHVRGG